MKKRILAMMLASAMVAGIVGCGGSSDSKDTKEEIKTENPLDKKMTEGICCVSRNSRARLLRCGLVFFYRKFRRNFL